MASPPISFAALFVLASGSLAAASDPLREIAAARLGVPSERLEEIARARRSYPALGETLLAGSFRDPSTHRLATVSIDASGREREAAELDLLEEAAARAA
ncbi:MAG: hypothetical protein ACREIU_01100, partial [Planctomycetota bacterium]